jgi:hypothetical protein
MRVSRPESSRTELSVHRRVRPTTAIETVLLASTACLLAAVAWPIARDGLRTGEPAVIEQGDAEPTSPVVPADGPVIQIALVLDTSSSMDGLIDQARSQLWRVVNALDGATFHEGRPRLEVAVYEYGNDRLSVDGGFIRQVTPFTTELDTVSQALFGLATFGGSEWAGQAIQRSVSELGWRDGEGVLRVVYVAGNEPFAQGPVDWRESMTAAKSRAIVVNTVYCGAAESAESEEWRAAAVASGGKFLLIDMNHVEAYVPAPQDAEIARLGGEINTTFVPYGSKGGWGKDNLAVQDDNSAGYGMGSVIERSVAKSSANYRNDSWDLVDGVAEGGVRVGEIDRGSLPSELQGMSDEELTKHVEAQGAKRKEIQARLAQLASERAEFLAAEKAERTGTDTAGLDDAIIGSIREQAEAAGFTMGTK